MNEGGVTSFTKGRGRRGVIRVQRGPPGTDLSGRPHAGSCHRSC